MASISCSKFFFFLSHGARDKQVGIIQNQLIELQKKGEEDFWQ